MDDFTKLLQPCTTPCGRLFVTVTYKDGELSIIGVEGPKRNGDAKGSCGRCSGALTDGISKPATGWDEEMLLRLQAVWKRWHLNDMRAGSPAQERFLKEHARAIEALVNEDPIFTYYGAGLLLLNQAGLSPDPNYLHNGKPYIYGSAWLSEQVPQDVLAWLVGLPDSPIDHPWSDGYSVPCPAKTA